MTPAQTTQLLAETGFAVEACFGDFDGTSFDAATAHEQIWISRKDSRS